MKLVLTIYVYLQVSPLIKWLEEAEEESSDEEDDSDWFFIKNTLRITH